MPFVAPSNLFKTTPLQDLSVLTKALADETRLRILALLQERELCACQIVEAFELANSTISKHLAILKQAGLIQSRKQGRWIYFFLPRDPFPEIVSTLQWLAPFLQADPTLKADQEKMQAILQMDPIELCRRQNSPDCC
jgi:ArsR family transcriptional regulator